MIKLLRFLKDYKKESVLSPLFKMLEAFFELIVPLVMAYIIDVGIVNRDKNSVLLMGGILAGLGVIGLVCSITAQYYAAKAAVGFGTELRFALFSHIQSLSYTEVDQVGSGTLITRMTSDVNQIQTGVNLVLRLFLRSPFIVLGAMIMAFTIDVRSALIFTVTIPLLSVVVFGIMLISIPLYKKVQEKLDRLLILTRENLVGARVIRAFHMEEEECVTFQKENQELNRLQRYVGKISGLMNPVTYVMINGAIIILVWTGGIQVDTGKITQGGVIALVNYMSQILVELIKLAMLIITVTKSFASASRVQTIFDMESSVKEHIESQKNFINCAEQETYAIRKQENGNDEQKEKSETGNSEFQEKMVEFRKVCFRYDSAAEDSLTEISFTAGKGETIGIIGGTGSGKTSLIHLIPRFYDAVQGMVCIMGKDVREYSHRTLINKIAIVPQEAVLFQGTIRENLKWGKEDATDEELRHSLFVAQAMDFVMKLPEGMETIVSQGGKNLSGGQRQRLTIARALVKKPEILILDDSTSALDFATDQKLRQALKEETNRMTVFLVSQRTSSLQNADKIIVLDDGVMAGMGTHEELLENCPLYLEIYQSQYRKPERSLSNSGKAVFKEDRDEN